MSKKSEAEIIHDYRVKEIELEYKFRKEIEEFRRKTESIKHQWAMERLRITNAEIKKRDEARHSRRSY